MEFPRRALARARGGKATARALPWPWLLAAGFMVVFMVGPLVALAARVPSTSASDYRRPYLIDALRVSLFTATAAVWLDAIVGIPLGFWLARTRSKARHVVTAAVLLPLALPPVVAGIVLLLFLVVRRDAPGGLGLVSLSLSFRIVNTLLGSVLAQMYVAAPFIVMATRAAVADVDRAFEDAARSLGCTQRRALEKVVLPLARRGIVLGLVLGWVRCMGEFGAVSVVAYFPHTLPVLTYDLFQGSGFEPAIPPSAVLAVVGSLAAGTVLWLSLDRERVRPRRKLRPRTTGGSSRESQGPQGARDAAPDFESVGIPTADLDVDIALVAGEFHLEVAFQAPPGITAILGPSGAGKSLTLRAMAGFLQPHQGHIALGERTLVDAGRGINLGPEQRRLGYVAQRDALFEHLSVEDNVGFGLWRLHRGARAAAVSRLLRDLEVEPRRHLSPRSLSGGERQRVALARALAPAPSALLLDEAFSALDAPLRHHARRLVRTLHARTGIPIVLVTHDREDVLDLAGYVVVIAAGRVLQQGPIWEVFSRPATAEAARLVGFTNLLAARGFDRIDSESGTATGIVVTDWGAVIVNVPIGADETWKVAVPADAVTLEFGTGDATVEAVRPATTGGWSVELVSRAADEPLDAYVGRPQCREMPALGAPCRPVIDGTRCCLVAATGAPPHLGSVPRQVDQGDQTGPPVDAIDV